MITVKELYGIPYENLKWRHSVLIRLHQVGIFLKLTYYALRNWAIIDPPHEWHIICVTGNNNTALTATIIVVESDRRYWRRFLRWLRLLKEKGVNCERS